MLEFVQWSATLPFSAGEAVRELSGNLSPLAGPGLFTPQGLISLICISHSPSIKWKDWIVSPPPPAKVSFHSEVSQFHEVQNLVRGSQGQQGFRRCRGPAGTTSYFSRKPREAGAGCAAFVELGEPRRVCSRLKRRRPWLCPFSPLSCTCSEMLSFLPATRSSASLRPRSALKLPKSSQLSSCPCKRRGDQSCLVVF